MAAHTGSAVRDRAGAKYIKLSTGMGISCSAGLSKLKAVRVAAAAAGGLPRAGLRQGGVK